MTPRTPWLVLLLGVALTGCLKDGVEPPTPSSAVPALELRFDLHCDGKPYHRDSLYRDGFSTLVRIERFRSGLIGAALLDDEGRSLGSWPGTLLPVDLAQPGSRVLLDAPATGEAHWLDARLLSAADATAGLWDSLWIVQPGDGFHAVLDLGGTYDSNDNGRIDADDQPFRIAVPAPSVEEPFLIHAHALIPADVTGVLLVPVNLRALLHDIDLPDRPITIGAGAYATQALQNLRTRVWGDDNKPQ